MDTLYIFFSLNEDQHLVQLALIYLLHDPFHISKYPFFIAHHNIFENGTLRYLSSKS